MHVPTVILGAVAILYGIYTLWARSAKPHHFPKLEVMKKQMGAGKATLIHTIAYSVIPIILGILVLMAGLSGRSIL